MPYRYLRILLIIILFSLSGYNGWAQDAEYDYYFNDFSTSYEPGGEGLTGEEYFYAPLGDAGSVFPGMSEFNFSSVRYRRRGYAPALDRSRLSGVELGGGITASADYWLRSMLRRARVNRSYAPERFSSRDAMWITGAGESFNASAEGLLSGHGASVYATDRTGRAGLRLHSAGRIAPSLAYSATGYRRWGRDAEVEGVFTDETSYFAQLGARLREGHSLSLLAVGTFSERGLRSAATREAFALTGNHYYNPSWGYQDGDVRNGRVERRARTMIVTDYSGRLTETTTIDATAAFRFGKRSVSALGWREAMNPYPDHYRKMPSWAESPGAEEIIRQAWAEGGSGVTQIDWDELYRRNATTPEDTYYYQEWRVEDVRDFQAAVSGRTQAGVRTAIGYGVRLRIEDTRRYKEMKDRMGSAPAPDLDPYLPAGAAANDLRTSGRLVRKGDRFGYDYTVAGSEYSAYAQVSHVGGRYAVAGEAQIGRATLQREGHYEKAAYPGAMSYGKSHRAEFDTYEVKAAFRYSFSPRHIVTLSASAAARAPWYGSVFVSPDYVNLTVGDPTELKVLNAELDYNLVLERFRATLTGYLTTTSDETAVYRYYDDITSCYSDMTLSGVDKRYLGVEIGAAYDFTPRLTLRAAIAAGRYEYHSDPGVNIADDATMTPYVEGSRSYLRGYRVGGSPEIALSAELRYRNRGWTASLTVSRMDGRYISPTPLRRMERAYNLAGGGDLFDRFVAQEKLNAAITLDLFVMKSFTIAGRHNMSVLLSVGNLLGDRDTIYDGYELMRVGRRGRYPNVNFMPFESKYTYSRGRTWYASVSYGF